MRFRIRLPEHFPFRQDDIAGGLHREMKPLDSKSNNISVITVYFLPTKRSNPGSRGERGAFARRPSLDGLGGLLVELIHKLSGIA
jgi:hypothetical protein